MKKSPKAWLCDVLEKLSSSDARQILAFEHWETVGFFFFSVLMQQDRTIVRASVWSIELKKIFLSV